MASIIYNRFLANLANKVVDWEADVIKVALLASSHTPDKDHNQFSDVSGDEVSGTGYTAGGKTLGSASVTQDDANDKIVLDGADTSWASSTITAQYAVLYDSTLAGNDLIALIDFGSEKSSTNGEFKIEWSTDGILSVAQA